MKANLENLKEVYRACNETNGCMIIEYKYGKIKILHGDKMREFYNSAIRRYIDCGSIMSENESIAFIGYCDKEVYRYLGG